MGTMIEYPNRSHELSRRFLQTAVVVDDKAYMASEQGNKLKQDVVEPSRTQPASRQNDQNQIDSRSRQNLDTSSIINSFSNLGVICGVVSPTNSVSETIRKADIVVLDWFLQDNDPQYTLNLLKNLLAGESDRNSLRLVSIYTGEAQLDTVCAEVTRELKQANLNPSRDNTGTTISYQHGCVVIYAKSGVNLAETFQDRSVTEGNLPKKLVDDFASMTSGLLSRIVLTSLTAVRENEHKILDQFGAKLDPAFLAHKACLPNPEDAEGQIVNHIAEELRGLMDNAIAEISHEDADAVEYWIKNKEKEEFIFNEKKLNVEETIKLVNKGLQNSSLKDRHFKVLSAGFSDSSVIGLDEQLAWMMSFRTVYNAPLPTLWLGSVVTKLSDEGEPQHLICMRPRCDCVRLKDETTFFFLSLKPEKKKEQIVVKLDNDTFKLLGIEFDSAGWILQKFKPSKENNAVIAKRSESNSHFKFTDSDNTQYKWQGELKAEYAQRIARNFAEKLSRLAVDESEWLRRMAK